MPDASDSAGETPVPRNESSIPTTQLRPLQLIVGAMMLSVVAFLAVVLVVGLTTKRESSAEERQTLITYITIAYGIGTILVGPYLSRSIAAAARRRIARETAGACKDAEAAAPDQQDQAAKLLDVFKAKTIIGAAMDEAAGLFACVAYLLEGRSAAAGLAAILVLSIFLNRPTKRRAEQWLSEQLRLMENEGQGVL
jgi:hypothetical protein